VNVKLATALSVAGVLLAAGSAAAVNSQVLDSGSKSSIGSADDFVAGTTPSPVPTITQDVILPPTEAPETTIVDDNGGTRPTSSPSASDDDDDNGGRTDRDNRTEAGDDRDAKPSPSASDDDDDDDRSGSNSGSDDD
jgi:hypothetical protein